MTETQLTDELHRFAEGIDDPAGAIEGDLARGRARLRRRRTALAGGAAAVALAGGLVWSAVDTDRAPSVAVAPDLAPLDVAPAGPPAQVVSDLEARIRDLAGRTGTREDELPAITLNQLQAVTDALQERVPGPLGWLSVGTFDSWRAAGAGTCPQGWACEDARVRGAYRARWAESGAVHQLAVDFGGGIHLFTLNGADERPAEVAWGERRP